MHWRDVANFARAMLWHVAQFIPPTDIFMRYLIGSALLLFTLSLVGCGEVQDNLNNEDLPGPDPSSATEPSGGGEPELIEEGP